MQTQSPTCEQVYQTITGRRIPLSGLSDAEYGFLDTVAKKYGVRQRWTQFAAWWNAKFNASGLSTVSVVYRICQDLEARLGINQGKVSPPDYRDYLAELIDTQFGSRQEFCRATDVDAGQLSRVLANRDNLSIKVLLQVLEVLHAQLVIRTDDDSRGQISIDRAADAVIAAVKLWRTRSEPQHAPFAEESSQSNPKIGSAVPLDWRAAFPNVHDMETVVDSAYIVADQKMPLMIANAA